MTIEQLIIDTDPGIDDAITLLVAMASADIGKLLVTAVHGNVSVDRTYKNALGLAALAGRKDVRIVKGAEKPLAGRTLAHAADVHGDDGLHGLVLPDVSDGHESEDAVSAIIKTINASDAPVVVLALGALTNIAKAVQKDPAIAGKTRLVVMGGAFEDDGMGTNRSVSGKIGNITPYAEFNMYVDPDAADLVLKTFHDVWLYPLNLTRQVRVSRPFCQKLKEAGHPLGESLARMLEAYLDGGAGNERPLHDANTLVGLLRPGFYSGIMKGKVHVDTSGETKGQSHFRPDPHGNVNVVTSANAPAVLSFIHERLNALGQSLF